MTAGDEVEPFKLDALSAATRTDGGSGALRPPAAPPSAASDEIRRADAGDRRGRALNLAIMFFAPLLVVVVLSCYAGPAHDSAEGRAAFLLFTACVAAVVVMLGFVAWASVLFRWQFGPRRWLRALASTLAIMAPIFVAGNAAFAYGLPACLTLPFVPGFINNSWWGLAVPAALAAHGAAARRRLQRLHAAEGPPAVPAAAAGLGPPAVFDVEGEPLAPRARPAAAWRRASVSSPDELTAALATPDGSRAVQWQLLVFMFSFLLFLYPFWGYLYLFVIFESSGAAQVFISLAFSLFSFAMCYGVLRAFRGLLCAMLPGGVGQGYMLLWLLHFLRSFRLWSSFRASSPYVLAFGVLSDAAAAFAPLLLAAPSSALSRRAGRLLALLLRPARDRLRARKALSSAPAEAAGEEGRLAREGGRALFFLQALVSILASAQFVVTLTLLRFGPSAHAWPYHPSVLPHETYVATAGAAAASVAVLGLGLLALRGAAAGALAGGRGAAVRDGFALGWELVEGLGGRAAGLWVLSTVVTASTYVRGFNVFSSVFPASYPPLLPPPA